MSVSGINSLLNNLIAKYSGQQSSSESKTTTTSTDSSGDTVSLSARLKELQSQAVLKAKASLLGGALDSQDSIASVMLGNQDSADAMTSVLMDAANARMMKSNPKLVKELLAQKESAANASGSKSEGSGIENFKSINLFSLNADTIKSLLKQNSESTGSRSSSTSGTNKVV
jgi:hypothetical protein